MRLGPFKLGGQIGEGGMGAVYRATHRETGVEVAIKVIRRAVGPEMRKQFRREVQAHARLQHPGIVYLFETGTIGKAAASVSDGELRAGAPFVAMEMAEGGTVRREMPLGGWRTVGRGLIQALDALAYSHARGVVHRDLKPENFLVFEDDEAGEDWRVKLADFGIAHAFSRERAAELEELESVAGTPQYMAPEQLRGQWRRYGPWTDLYALGCIAWELVCGRPPFTGETPFAMAISHETDERPRLEPQFPVPEELERWIHRAMAVEPSERFRRAADAAWALPREGLASSTDPGAAGKREDRESSLSVDAGEPTSVLTTVRVGSTTAGLRETLPADVSGETPNGRRGPEAAGGRADGPPPVPEEWRPEQSDPLPAPLVGTGLGLFGLREPPFVDRKRESDLIWEKLREAVESEAPRHIVVAGEAGTGKSRLAEWMATRAHELGAARVVRAFHSRDGGPSEGLRGALERTLRTVKMGRSDIHAHLRERLRKFEPDPGDRAERDARALTEYLRPTDRDADEVDGPHHRFASLRQRRALLVRVLRRLARRRPVLLWLDDLQWGREALGVLEHLYASDDEPRVVVLATVRSDVVSETPSLAERLEALASRETALRIPLEPLGRRDQQTLLEGLLPLEARLAEALAERTEGHPLFAMQLLGHWIERGAIEVGDDGFRVPDGRDLELPDDIHELWVSRLERLVADLEALDAATVWRVLERTAALGREVDAAEWWAVCETVGLERPELLRRELVERGLAELTDEGGSFAHGLLVDSIERQARSAGRWQQHHRRCAKLLSDLQDDRGVGAAARRADHWVEAGELDRAIDALWEEYEVLDVHGDPERMLQVLGRREQLLDRIDAPEDDRRRLENDLAIFGRRHSLGTPADEILSDLREARRHARTIGDDELLAEAWKITSRIQYGTGRFEEAVESGERAVSQSADAGADRGRTRALDSLGWVQLELGDLGEAEQRAREALRCATESGLRHEKFSPKRLLAIVEMTRGAEERARALLEEIVAETREVGNWKMEALALNGLGELARFTGDAESARTHYLEFRRLFRELNQSYHVATASLNLAQVEVLAGRWAAARRQLREAERRLEALCRTSEHLHLLRLTDLARAAGEGDWSRFGEIWSRYDVGWPDDARSLKDHSWLLEMAGDRAAEQGEATRARKAWRLARHLWERLDDAEAADEVAAKLEDV